MKAPVLVCTVGGSPEPVISAVRACRPRFVCFVATKTEGGVKGSAETIDGEGGIAAWACLALGQFNIGAAGEADPEIRSAQLGGSVLLHKVLTVPHDDPDRAFALLAAEIDRLQVRFPDSPFIADYTGGTKSMSAALINAAIERPGVALQVMTGVRSDLSKVQAGTEHPFAISTDRIVTARQISLLRESWTRFGYAEAAAGFALLRQGLPDDATEEMQRRLADLYHLSAAFAAWDRFDHKHVNDGLNRVKGRYGDWTAPWIARQRQLCLRDSDASPPFQSHPYKLCDLWLNAERRAARGRYDDAVARLYRLLEWTGQWLLKTRHGIDAGKVNWTKIASERLERAGVEPRRGQTDLGGLVATVRLLAAYEPGGAMECLLGEVEVDQRDGKLSELLRLRNRSILAHGFDPLSNDDWNRWRSFVHDTFLPRILLPELRALGVLEMPAQLPSEPPEGL